MASISLARTRGGGAGALLFACVAESGSASHPWFGSDALVRGPEAARNLADMIHFLCVLHGRQPGIIDLAATRALEPEARAWLDPAGAAFADERLYLTKLAVAAGPMPGTPGGAAGEAAVLQQRRSLATLAQSERKGCALGAAIAFAADWAPIRALLDVAAARLGVEIPEFRLGGAAELEALAGRAGAGRAAERALLFGAEQVALQHRGMWDLLEARAEARREI